MFSVANSYYGSEVACRIVSYYGSEVIRHSAWTVKVSAKGMTVKVSAQGG